jgi:HEAT repeat protein
MLATRGDPSAVPAVTAALKSGEKVVRLAAIDALSLLGDGSAVPVLAAHAAARSDDERDRARSALDRIKGDSINPALVKLLEHPEANLRAEALRSLAARSATDSAAAVMKAAKDEDATVRNEAAKALRVLAGVEQVPDLLSIMLAADDKAWRGEVERAAIAAVRRIKAKSKAAEAALKSFKSANSGEKKAAVIRVLGATGDASALPTLLDAVKKGDGEVKDAAIRGLAAWPTAAPGDTLRDIARDPGNSAAHRVIAMRGYIEKIELYADADDEEILRRYEQAMKDATRPEESILVLSKLATFRDPAALELVRKMKADPKLKSSAETAEKKIQALLSRPANVRASHNADKAIQAVDGNMGTRWDTGGAMQGGEWFTIDLGRAQQVNGLVLNATGSNGDYPRAYEVYASPNRIGRGTLVTKGKGTKAVVDIVFEKPVRARTLTIVQTGKTDGLFWSIHELTVKTAK